MAHGVFFAVNRHCCLCVRAAYGRAAATFAFQSCLLIIGRRYLQCEQIVEGIRYIGQGDAILWAAWSSEAGFYCAHIEMQAVGKFRLITGFTPQALCLAVGFNSLDYIIGATTQAHVIEGFIVDGEETTGRTVLRCHIGDGGTVCEWQVGKAIAVEFDELTDNAFVTQHLGDRKHQVGGGHAFRHFTREFETNDFRYQHGNGLAQHGRLCFDAANTPAQYTDTVNHRGVRVGAYERIRVSPVFTVHIGGPNTLSEIFKVHLVTDTRTGRHNAEIIKGGLAPAQESVAFAIALHFDFYVIVKRLIIGKAIHHH